MSYSSQASWLNALCWRRIMVCKCTTMLGTISGDFFDSRAMYWEKQRVHVIMSVTCLWALCCCIAWNWLKAPTRLSWREEDGLSCSSIRSERGAGRNSSMSTYSRFHTLSTSFMGRLTDLFLPGTLLALTPPCLLPFGAQVKKPVME